MLAQINHGKTRAAGGLAARMHARALAMGHHTAGFPKRPEVAFSENVAILPTKPAPLNRRQQPWGAVLLRNQFLCFVVADGPLLLSIPMDLPPDLVSNDA